MYMDTDPIPHVRLNCVLYNYFHTTINSYLMFQALAFICIALLRHYGLNFGADSVWGNSQSMLDRRLVGIIAIGSSILISLPLLFGYIFFAHSSNLLVSVCH